MSIETLLTVRCDWPGCERIHTAAEPTDREARLAVKLLGWDRMATGDFCPIHPRHEGAFADAGFRLCCRTCGWVDNDLVKADTSTAKQRWITHLPPITIGYDGSEHAARNLAAAQEKAQKGSP